MDYTICVAKTKALISCAVTGCCSAPLLLHMQNTGFLMVQLNIWCKNKFYLVNGLNGFNCVWRFSRVVLHVGSGCQSNIKADCLNLLSRPAPVITRVEIL